MKQRHFNIVQHRYVYFDVMRILAIFLVLMNHQPAYKLYFHERGVWEIMSLFEAIIIRINVPLFAMISGALLLGRSESISELWHKRISRILWAILIFSSLLYCELGWLRNRDIVFHDFFYGLFASTLKNLDSYWYLYAYLGFLLMLPFMRKVARLMSKEEFYWLLGLHIVFSTLFPLISFGLQVEGFDSLKISGTISIPLSSTTLLFYPLIGYYLNKNINIESITKRQWCYMTLACIICSSITALIIFTEGTLMKFSQHYVDIFTYVNAIVVFLALKKIFHNGFTVKHGTVSKIVSFIAPLTFGIYLLDLAVQLPIYRELSASVKPVIGKFWFSVMWCCISFILGGSITYILKRLPFFKKIL